MVFIFNKYFEIINEDNDKDYCYYLLEINWIPENIITDFCDTGFIIQKVNLINDTSIKEIKNITYYEAWEVKNKKIIKSNESISDDSFKYLDFDNIDEIIKDSLGKIGAITYETEVYWISKNNILYPSIAKWKYGDVVEAGTLKSILASKYHLLDDEIPVFKRKFTHNVIFQDYNKVKECILDLYSDMIKEKDQNLNKKLHKILKNTDYAYIIDEINNENY